MRFGISLGATDLEVVLSTAREAEAAGLDSFWLYDAHRVWMDPYPILALVARETIRLRFGLCVTNPVTRSPAMTALLTATLDRISRGRAELGIGRGDVSVRAMGHVPARLDVLEEAIARFRTEVSSIDASWRPPRPIPVWVGTYGPRGLQMAGRAGDGVIIQFADEELVAWALRHARSAARPLRVMCGAPMAVDMSPSDALARTRWFARMIGHDVATIVDADAFAFSPALVEWAREYLGADVDNRRLVADRLSDRLALVGSIDDCKARLARLAALGVEEMNVFTLGEEEARSIDVIRRLMD
jgi:alkanesulfonate monooxygenase SsuD/methylene tetrahydromethanopterin reductase-like flavin-dependent oxidoreductase (luciferase family)